MKWSLGTEWKASRIRACVHVLAPSYLTSLGFHFLYCETGIIVPISQDFSED